MSECPYKNWTLEESTTYLRDLLGEFPFTDRPAPGTAVPGWNCRSMSVQVAAMLSQFCVSMLPSGAARMGFIYNANSQRSGKSLLAKISVTPIHGSFKPSTWKSSEEELNKVIDSMVLGGSTYICFDNVRGYLASQTLEAIMTSPEWTGRVLGKTEMFTAPNRMTLFVTGNDCILSPDLDHRILMCDLFVPEGDVQERSPISVIDDTWLLERDNRINILSSLSGIVRAWHAGGMPMASSYGYKARVGFERWGELIGGIVAFAGFGNCLERPMSDTAGDSEGRNIRNLIKVLVDSAIHKHQEYSFQQVVDHCHDNDIFDWMLEGRMVDGSYVLQAKSKSKFGLTLGRYAPNIDKTKSARSYKLPDGKTVMFGCSESGRKKRYFIETEDPE
jgi:hypothetical protein